MRKSVSPAIAMVVLVFVGVLVSVALFSYVLSIWEKFGDVEVLRVVPGGSALIADEQGSLVKVRVLLRNEGTVNVKVIKVTLEGVGSCDLAKVIEKGKEGEIVCQLWGVNVNAKALYTVMLLTESGSVYKLTLEAREMEN